MLIPENISGYPESCAGKNYDFIGDGQRVAITLLQPKEGELIPGGMQRTIVGASLVPEVLYQGFARVFGNYEIQFRHVTEATGSRRLSDLLSGGLTDSAVREAVNSIESQMAAIRKLGSVPSLDSLLEQAAKH